ncbi:Cytochrome P450 [Mycena kentingensis (nom. inval.)]|nr:Cytochrome P450 [Mycena kentingensis (nom. inval.)]
MFPDNVERLIIDGVGYAPDYYATEWATNLLDTDKAYQSFATGCAAAGRALCAFHAPTPSEILANIDALGASLRAAPIPVNAGATYGLVDFSLLRGVIFNALYKPHALFPGLAQALADLRDGNATTIWTMSAQIAPASVAPADACGAEDPFESVTEAIWAIACNDGARIPSGYAEFAAHYQRLVRTSSFADNWEAPRMGCLTWPDFPKDSFQGPFAGNTSFPLLVIGNTADPVTPLESARNMSAAFPGAVLLTQDSAGHCSVSDPSTCTAAHVRAYFLNGTLPEAGTICSPDEPVFGAPESEPEHAVRREEGGRGGGECFEEYRDEVPCGAGLSQRGLDHIFILFCSSFVHSSETSLLLGAVLSYTLNLLFQRSRTSTRALPPLPPGPPGLPLIGNLFQIPTEQAAEVYHAWAKTYGDVIYVSVCGTSMLILDTHRDEAAVDLLEKRSAVFSSRPTFTVYNIIGLGNENILTLILHLHKQKCIDYQRHQEAEAEALLANISECAEGDAEAHDQCLIRFATGILARVTAGHEIKSAKDDPFLFYASIIFEMFGKTGLPGATPVDLFPILKYFPSWFPGTHYANAARAYKKLAADTLEFLIKYVEDKQKSNQVAPSLVLTNLEELAEALNSGTPPMLDREEVMYLAFTIFGAGRATTASTLAVFILAMVAHPEVQMKAQAELDAVLGIGKDRRLPKLADEAALPYIELVIQETMRWNPVVPLGIPHLSTEDDIYRGMYIPKGTLVFPNIRGISLDQSVYHNPRAFTPERFLAQPEGRGEPYSSDAFGFGRRICPELHLARDSLWIGIATLLATCTISPVVDAEGRPIIPDVKLSEGLDAHPKHMRCIIR